MPTGLGPPWGSPVHPGAAASCILVRGRQLSPANPAPSISQLHAAASPALWLSWPCQGPGRGSPVAAPHRVPVPQAGDDGRGCITRAQPWGTGGLGRAVGQGCGGTRGPAQSPSPCSSSWSFPMCQKRTGKDGTGEHGTDATGAPWGGEEPQHPAQRVPAWAPAEPPGPGSPGPRTLREGGPGRAMQCERTPGEGPTAPAPAAPEPQPQRRRGHQWG